MLMPISYATSACFMKFPAGEVPHGVNMIECIDVTYAGSRSMCMLNKCTCYKAEAMGNPEMGMHVSCSTCLVSLIKPAKLTLTVVFGQCFLQRLEVSTLRGCLTSQQELTFQHIQDSGTVKHKFSTIRLLFLQVVIILVFQRVVPPKCAHINFCTHYSYSQSRFSIEKVIFNISAMAQRAQRFWFLQFGH